MNASFSITIVFAGLIAAGCSTTTYLSLTENDREQVEEQLKYDEQDENVGAEITLLLKDRTEIKGELLSVRDTTMIICTEHSATEEELANLIYPINTVRNDEIKELTLEGSNYVWAGLGIGIVAGTLTGILVGSLLEENRQAYISHEAGFGVLGFIVGAIAGPIIGHALSTEEFVLQEIPPGYNFSLLKPLAHYPDEEPEYLKVIK
jgi:hypothetical protein